MSSIARSLVGKGWPRSALSVTSGPSRTPILAGPTALSGRWLSTRPASPAPSRYLSRRWNSSESDASRRLEAPAEGSKPQKIGQIEPRLSMSMTCTADGCGHRSTHEFTKRSYEKGIVIVQCPECKNRHLIADRLGWFKESMEDGKLKTVEDLLKAKGEKVRKGRVTMDGTIEYEGE